VASLPSYREVWEFLVSVGAVWLIGTMVVACILVGWPAELFNTTYRENETVIRGWLRWSKVRATPAEPRVSSWPVVFSFAAVTAVLMTVVQVAPDFGKNLWATAFGYLIAIPLVMISYEFAMESHLRNSPSGGIARLRVVLPALVIALVCASASRLFRFEPGYVYGLIITYSAVAPRAQLPARTKAVAVVRSAAVLLLLATGSWVLWQFGTSPVINAGSSSVPLGVLDTILAQIVILSLETLVIGLIPIRFLHGRLLWRWNKLAWFGIYALSASMFVTLLIGPIARRGSASDLVASLWLFLGFAAGSGAFWALFAHRRQKTRRPAPAKYK
jgi:hypothetical protein